jgi:hypothetical protein
MLTVPHSIVTVTWHYILHNMTLHHTALHYITLVRKGRFFYPTEGRQTLQWWQCQQSATEDFFPKWKSLRIGFSSQKIQRELDRDLKGGGGGEGLGEGGGAGLSLHGLRHPHPPNCPPPPFQVPVRCNGWCWYGRGGIRGSGKQLCSVK